MVTLLFFTFLYKTVGEAFSNKIWSFGASILFEVVTYTSCSTILLRNGLCFLRSDTK